MRDPYDVNEHDAERQAEERRAARSPRDWTVPVVSTLVLIGVAAALYYYSNLERSAPGEATPAAAAEAEQEPPVSPEPDVRYPINRPDTPTKQLPPLAKSDPELFAAFGELLSKDALTYFHQDSFVRRIVVTTDNLSRDKIPQRYAMTKPVDSSFRVSGKNNEYTVRADNYARYTPYVRALETVDTKKLMGMYVYFYPLLQEEYRNIGSSKQYYNDRVVEVIDNLLATPEVTEPIKLVQPKVFYEFADPSLEALSAGQKLLLRMGPENAARVKAKLRDIRQELVASR